MSKSERYEILRECFFTATDAIDSKKLAKELLKIRDDSNE